MENLNKLQVLKNLSPIVFFAAILLFSNNSLNAQCVAPCFFVEDFETNGTGTRYTADFQFSDGSSDYFGRVNHNGGAPVLTDVCAGVSIHVVNGLGAPNGSHYMAGEDLDDPSTPDCGTNNANDEKNIVFDNIDIDGSSDITVKFLLSVGSGQSCSTTAAAWDTDDFIRVFYEKDAGGEQQAYCFRNNTVCGNSNNQPFTSDPNCDGNTADGMIVPNSFTEFSFTIDNTVTTASELDLRFNIHSDATNEEFAIDYIRLEAATPPGGGVTFVCPTIGGVSVAATGCDNEDFDITVTGLADMLASENGETNFNVELVAFPTATATPYTGGTLLGTITNPGNGSATLPGGASIATAGSYIIYARLAPAPTMDVNCRPSASGSITINAAPNPSFSSQATYCLSDPTQTGLSGGSPAGGTYSGPGVTDNGGTFSFNPTTATVGMHTIEYEVTSNGCSETATTIIEVTAVPPGPSISDISVCPGGIATITPPAGTGSMVTLAEQDFDGGGLNFTPSTDFNVSSNDHFSQTDGSDISNVSGAYSFVGGGNQFWAAEDTDAGSSTNDEQSLTFDGIAIGGTSDISIALDVAAGNTVPTSVGYDALDHMIVEYSTNVNGSWMDAHCFNYDDMGSNFNEPLHHDTDCDGDGGEGPQLTPTAQTFTFNIPNAETIDAGATSLFIRIRVYMDAANEEVAFDNIIAKGMASSSQYKFYDADPAGGSATLLAGPAASYDFQTTVGDSPESVWVTACSSPCDSDATEVEITQEDVVAPSISCPGTISDVVLGATCSATLSSYISNVTASDNCDTDLAITQSPMSGTTINGPQTVNVTLTATDDAGLMNTCIYMVSFVDNTPPTALCQNVTVDIEENGMGILSADDVDNASSDNCGIMSYSLGAGQDMYDCDDVGAEIEVTLTVTDDSGNPATCTAMVSVQDNMDPIVTCNATATVQLDASGEFAVDIAYVLSQITSANDNCGIDFSFVTRGGGPAVLTCDNAGEEIDYLFGRADVNGNGGNCEITITVLDDNFPCNQPPVANCKNIMVSADANCQGMAVAADFDDGSFDPDGDDITFSVSPEGPYPIGDTDVIITVSDGTLTTECPSTITVEDNTAPAIIGTGCEVSNANGSAYDDGWDSGDTDIDGLGAWGLNSSPGNSGFFVYTSTENGNGDNNGDDDIDSDVNRAWGMYADGANAVASRVFTEVFAPGSTFSIQLDHGNREGTGATNRFMLFNLGGDILFRLDAPATGTFYTLEIGTTGLITTDIPITDEGIQVDIVQVDATTIATTITALDSGMSSTYTDSFLNGMPGPIDRMIVSSNSGGPGLANNYYCNNIKLCYAKCLDDVIVSAGANCTAVVNFDAIAIDNCDGELPLSYNPASGSAFILGETTVTASVMDNAGNMSSCTFTVTVNDTEAPTANCPGNITVSNDTGDCGADVSYSASASDNCPGASVSLSIPSGSFFAVGTHTVSATATDAAGNTGGCSFNVTVKDTENPSIGCPNSFSVTADMAGCTAEVTIPTPTTADNCGIMGNRYRFREVDENGADIPGEDWSGYTTAASQVFAKGYWKIEWMTRDLSGNQNECDFIITIEANDAPTFTGTIDDVDLYTDDGASCPWDAFNECIAFFGPLFGTEFTPGASFTIAGQTQNYPDVSLFDDDVTAPGDLRLILDGWGKGTDGCETTITLKWILVDDCGTESASVLSQTFNIYDNTKPVLNCSGLNLTVPAEEGLCGATVTVPAPTATDNCQAEVMIDARYRLVDENNNNLGPWSNWTDDPSGFFEVGRYKIRWRASDGCGNTRGCTRYLTVEDTQPPMVDCYNMDVFFDGEEFIPLNVDDLAEASDNCGVASLELDITEISCEDLGETIPVTATAVDVNGLENSCIAYVTVKGLPCGWSDQPIGCEGEVSYDVPNEEFTVGGVDCHNPISNSSDEYAFAAYNLCGNGTITAQVTSIIGTSNGWAGVTMRETTDPGSKSVSMMTNLSSNHRIETRTSTGGTVVSQLMPAYNRHWLRIKRVGNSFRLYASSNGVSWFLRSSRTVSMQSCIEVGLAVNGYVGSNQMTGTFENVTVTGDTFFELNGTPGDNFEQEAPAAKTSFEIYPNPSSGVFNLNWMDEEERQGAIEVYNAQGQAVQLKNLEQHLNTIDLSTLPGGMYFLQIKLDDGTMQTERLILQHRP